MDISTLQLVTIGILIGISLIVGFVFGRWTEDDRNSNTVMMVVLGLLALVQTSFTVFDIFPELNKWTAILILFGWIAVSLIGVLEGFRQQTRQKIRSPR